MRVALLYAPPWKIRNADAPPHARELGRPLSVEAYGREGPPPEYRAGDLDADFYQVPYGLLSLAAQCLRAGHDAKVLNLSAFSWARVLEIVRDLEADIFGLSTWTANRRGVGYLAAALKQAHPQVPVVVGGPHASPLAEDMLKHHRAIDLVAVGESDDTLLELVDRIARAQDLAGVAGTVYRTPEGAITRAPERTQRKNLDDLASVHDYFGTHIVMTSRGCPWACTFCGAETSWGRGFRSNSVARVVDSLEAALARTPVRMLQIKDDTFTTHKKRVLEICREIRARKLNFFWSCDTRVDLLTDELLREMRLAGCQRLSLGVESGSQRILDAIDKKITVDEIVTSTALAKKYGIKVRHYMMLGNRGETVESFQETLAFLERARPSEYVFSCLSIYPGTRDFAEAELVGHAERDESTERASQGTGRRWLRREVFFEEPFQELKTPFDADEATVRVLNDWFRGHSGLQTIHRPDLAEYERIAAALGEPYHAAEMDLALGAYEAGDLDRATRHLDRAEELGYPHPGLLGNHRACIAYRRGDLDAMMDAFSLAAKVDPQHHVLLRNVERARRWFKEGGYARREPLDLVMRHDFQLFERTLQPMLPGPLPEDFALWDATRAACREALPRPVERPADAVELTFVEEAFGKSPEEEGSRAPLRTVVRTKLRVVE